MKELFVSPALINPESLVRLETLLYYLELLEKKEEFFAAINNKSDQGNDANSSVIPPKNVYPRLACKEKEEIVKELNVTLPISSMGSEGNSALLFRVSR